MAERYRPVSGRRLVSILEGFGWYVHRIRGSHHIMRHPDRPRVTLSIAVHGSAELPLGTQSAILKDAGLTPEEFNKRL